MTPSDYPRVPKVEYDPDSDAYHTSFDPTARSANEAVVESVAAVLRRDPLDVDPLYEYVDTDALDALVAAAPGKRSPYLSTSFRFENTGVTVTADGTIRIEPDADA